MANSQAASVHQPVDLTSCDREPIHIIGAIQSVGFLVATSQDWLISRVSANIAEFLDRSVEAMLGASLDTVLTREAVHSIRNRVTLLRGPDAVERIFALAVQPGGPLFDIAVHISDTTIVIEAEPSQSPGTLNSGAMVRSMMARMTGQADMVQEAARLVRALTGFDRVMIYRFHPDDSGEVIAERVRSGLTPFLGLRYPAEDIPLQARALLIRNPVRLLVDVDARPSLIVPQIDAMRQPLDLSMGTLRAHSLMCIEFLRNMGVGATMTVSLMRGGRLWGLISCHHMSAKHVGFEQRTTVELFGQLLAFLLEKQERDELAVYEARTHELRHQLTSALLGEGAPEQKMADLVDDLMALMPCDGLAVCIDDTVTLRGATPTPDELAGLRPLLGQSAAGRVFATDALGSIHGPAKEFVERAAGMLVVPLSASPRNYLIFFRHEIARSVVWGGEPGKLVEYGPNGPRLSPRKSFEAWRELKRGQSAPWSEAELRAAEVLRVTLLEAMLHASSANEREGRAVVKRQELLVAELNHRVRNILGLIRSLIAQSRTSAADIDTFATVLGDRVHALARAHDQITAKNWAPSSLATLISTEAGAFLGDGAARILASGPTILVKPQAFSNVALVMHELMTNAVKYGALSNSRGIVAIVWSLDPSGGITLDWHESGGPPVAEPMQRGFGSTIIQRSVQHELDGRTILDFAPGGLRAQLHLPAKHIVVGYEPAAIPVMAARDSGAGRLSGLALVVEDNIVIALAAEDFLLELGAARVLIAGNVSEALRLIDLEPPGFALLDINLGNETSWPVATRLGLLGVHYMFATGYGDSIEYPIEYRAATVIAKPYTADTIAQALGRHQAAR